SVWDPDLHSSRCAICLSWSYSSPKSALPSMASPAAGGVRDGAMSADPATSASTSWPLDKIKAVPVGPFDEGPRSVAGRSRQCRDDEPLVPLSTGSARQRAKYCPLPHVRRHVIDLRPEETFDGCESFRGSDGTR